jgi:hypothetical protein
VGVDNTPFLGGSPKRGRILISAPDSNDGSLNGRENLGLWAVQLNTSGKAPANGNGPLPAELVGRLWGCKGGYSYFDPSGTMNLFEAGLSFRYESIMLAHLNGTA